MDTTTAATQASVTVPTIRNWCRMGAVAAAKVSGRWVIELASLAQRIALTAPAKPVPTVETMLAIGGSRWTKGDMDRVYINDWAQHAGLEVSRYGTGNISSANFQGETISNGRAAKIFGAIDKVWYDDTDGKLYCRYGFDQPNWKDGSREDLWKLVVSGIRAAVAAL